MADVLSPVPKLKFFDNNGNPLNGGRLFTYIAGTSTKLATYVDSAGVTPNANPIVLDFRGECNCWVPPNVSYKYVLAPPGVDDPPTNPIFTVDNIVSAQLLTLYGGVDTGSANNYVLNFTANFTSYTDGIIIYWVPANTNFTSSTLNVNGLGAVSILTATGAAVSGGEIIAGQITQVIYLSGNWRLLSQAVITGTYSVQIFGVVGTVTGTARYIVSGRVVYLTLPILTGVSNSTGCSISHPLFLSPTADQRVSVPAGGFTDNSVRSSAIQMLIGPASTIATFLINGNASGFTAANNKGFPDASVCISWPLA